ncbi:hypothetical protein FZ934_20515 (plasmid) [Rhizobium grahamii]|uniref:Uncharacterized protein n=1 Tax=Rhizobium grahamii TaxID=1120045 RepID=A0A5Q0CBN3_9HYPH|nr:MULTISPECIES: hypothetical protein [Rhizobium]QFY62755.1 hypothetical protein FZ934_20515 [Rhizobium grahamii]QRM52500.1 hypothetical protein F3Y33_25145 [Rhizobium sp. BG6]
MQSHASSTTDVPYEQLVKRIEVLEERMRSHFSVIAILGAAAESPKKLLEMLSAYSDRHVGDEVQQTAPLWSDVVIANEVNAIMSVITAQHAGLRVIKGRD